MGLFGGSGSSEDEARRLRDRSREEDEASEKMQWHPRAGKDLADQSDETWREAREKSGDGGSNDDN